MKQEVFQERMDALNVKLRVVENEIKELQEEYIATYPYSQVISASTKTVHPVG